MKSIENGFHNWIWFNSSISDSPYNISNLTYGSVAALIHYWTGRKVRYTNINGKPLDRIYEDFQRMGWEREEKVKKVLKR